MMSLDKNGDGYLVLAEMQKGKGEEAKDQENRFRKMDFNGDNRVSPEEFRAHKAKKAKKVKKEKSENKGGKK